MKRKSRFKRSPKTVRKLSFVGKLERLSFPRRAFLKGCLVACAAGGSLGGAFYYRENLSCKTWKPGKGTWKPTVYAPSAEMDPIDEAIWLVKENICSYSIDDFLGMNLQPDQVYWMVSHQLRVRPITERDVKFYLSSLDRVPYTNQSLSFPLILQGHECQFIDTLLRCGRSRHVSECADGNMLSVLKEGGTRRFKIRGTATSLRELLMEEIRFCSPERLAIINSDPSWIISAFVGANPRPEDWRFYGDDTGVLKHATYAFEKIPGVDSFRLNHFACGGTHFQDALSRLYWYYGQFVNHSGYETGKMFSRLQRSILEFIRAYESKNEPLEYAYHPLNKYYMGWFRDDPKKENFIDIFKCVERLGHTLELMLDPQGYYFYNYPLDELKPVADALAEAIVHWYTPEFELHRKLIDTWVKEDDSPTYIDQLRALSKREQREVKKTKRQMERYTEIDNSHTMYSRLFMGGLCHAAKGLMLWKEYIGKRTAAKPSVAAQ